MNKYLNNSKQVLLAVEMAQRGARPSTISAITLLPTKTTKEIYQEVHGYVIQGKTATNLELFIVNKRATLASTYFCALYSSYKKYGIFDTTALIKSYDRTAEKFHTDNVPIISFDRAYLIQRELKMGENFYLAACKKCNSRYLAMKDRLQNDSKYCLICPTIKSSKL